MATWKCAGVLYSLGAVVQLLQDGLDGPDDDLSPESGLALLLAFSVLFWLSKAFPDKHQ